MHAPGGDLRRAQSYPGGVLMKLNHIFLAFMALVGIAAGAALVIKPELRDARIMPYFWVLIAMALFELGMYARLGGVFIGIEVRLLGFVLAILLMIGVPILAGSPGRLF